MSSKTILYITIRDETDFSFDNEQLSYFIQKLGVPNLFEVDNFSDALTLDYALKFLSENNKTTVIVEIKSKSELGRLLGLIYKLSELDLPTFLLQSVENDLSQKIINILSPTIVSNTEELKAIA